jgi:hypothetical protein
MEASTEDTTAAHTLNMARQRPPHPLLPRPTARPGTQPQLPHTTRPKDGVDTTVRLFPLIDIGLD